MRGGHWRALLAAMTCKEVQVNILKQTLYEGDEVIVGDEKLVVLAIGSGWIEFAGQPQLHRANQLLVGSVRLTLSNARKGYRASVAFKAPEGVEVLVLARDGDE